MEIKENKKLEKNLSKFYCEFCNFKCSQKCDWDRHILRQKHLSNKDGNKEEIKKLEKTFSCDCGKIFKTNAGLWKHHNKNSCKKIYDNENYLQSEITNNKTSSIIDKDELIIELLKQNKELLEIVKNGTTNNSHNTTTNSHNKAFNLQFFLNETCKDAMNIMDFVDSIKLQLTDLEKFGEIGYVEGISNIITTNLKAMDVTQRPVHCTDKKRETVYIKDENQWEKEDDNKTKLRKVIKKVANKNIKLLPQFRQKYPDYNNSSSKVSDKYDKMVIEAMGGSGDNDVEKEDKIIHNISKCTTINKYSE